MKHHSKWTTSQKSRVEILFEQYQAIKEAYDMSISLTQIFNNRCTKEVAITKLAHSYNQVKGLTSKFFKSVITTMQNNYAKITNYFVNRSTNAAAESPNTKVKVFRVQQLGITDIPFFIFRLSKLYV